MRNVVIKQNKAISVSQCDCYFHKTIELEKMARGKRKKTVVKEDSTKKYSLRARRSSMRVNLSYVSNVSDLEDSSSLKESNNNTDQITEESSVATDLEAVSKDVTNRPVESDTTATPASAANVTVINNDNRNLSNRVEETDETQNNSLQIIEDKEQQLNKTCMQLKNAIMNKTQALFDKENELAIKTTEILAAQCSPYTNQTTETHQENVLDKRSPSIRIDIGKNNQIIMTGDGRKRNPVQVIIHKSPERGDEKVSENADEEETNCNQSFASTPKKSRLENSKNYNKSSNTSDILLRIPVARLFGDDNDPNNRMFKINNLVNNNINILRTDVNNDDANTVNNNSEKLNELTYPTSPILSQGTRKSRVSRLSLKKKRVAKVKETSSNLSTCISNESFINRLPITCSSFIEQDKTNNRDVISKSSTTINLDEKPDSSVNCATINLEDNEISKTISIENSTNSSTNTTKSCMEITTVSSRMPIIRRSFQNLIRKSLKFEKVPFSDESMQNLSTAQKQKSPSTNQSKKSSLDCSANTVRTSLNVNTSLDQINSVESIMQKENQIPNNLNERNNKSKQTDEDDVIIQCQSTCIVRTSMQVNTSLDSVRKSIVPVSVIATEQNKNNKIIRQISDTDSNKETNNSDKISEPLLSNQGSEYSSGIRSRQPSSSTIRSSLRVNTSLDSARKSLDPTNLLDYNKILSLVEENTRTEGQNDLSECTSKTTSTSTSTSISKNQSSDSDNELENMSLMERIKHLSTSKKTRNNENRDKSDKSETNRKRKFDEVQESAPTSLRKSARVKNAKKNADKITDESSRSSLSRSRKSANTNTSSMANESSVIEATPYPVSRSVLMKTMIKNSIAMNTLDPRKLVDLSSDDSNSECQTTIKRPTNSTSKKHKNRQNKEKMKNQSLSDTVVLDSTDEVSSDSEQEKERVVIEESLDESSKDKSKTGENLTEELKTKKGLVKRKLYPLRENSQLISFSPSDLRESFKKSEAVVTKTKRKRKQTQKQKEENKVVTKSPEPAIERESIEENETITPEIVKPVKKKKKITSKKIVVKKLRNMSIIDTIIQNDEEIPQQLSDRNSLREFDLRRLKRRNENARNRHCKIVIVVTGLPKEEKDLVKSAIKVLGSATLEMTVTSRTTHVISSGIRTISLLKGIIRGCWLLSTEWALKSLESKKWLDPVPYEMCHFSKAVQENRRDRQLFGKAYVPELFVTCGFIYIENGTSPPASALKELVKTAGGRITEDPTRAEIVIGLEGLKEIWILDSITTGEVQPINQYKRN